MVKIEHINITAPRHVIETEKQFFCEVFALQPGFRPNFSKKGYWLYSNDSPLVHLTENSHRTGDSEPGFLDHVAFQLTDLSSLLQRLTRMKVAYTTDHVSEIGMTQVFFHSPSGIRLEANFINETLESA